MVFIPTYLYIKQHSITGKLYFGKTIKDPSKYLGSGVHWKRHLKVHGKEHVETLWFCLFYTKESIQEFALNFSKDQDIVESDKWLNLVSENGLDGSIKGAKSPMSGKTHSDETKSKMSLIHTNRIHPKLSSQQCKNISDGRKGKTYTKVICPQCLKEGGLNQMKRFHFDNCKIK